MTNEDKKKSLTRKLQDFMASYTGKVMLNYAYSWGAAVVILGALFKLTHLPGANLMLFIGMGTEVLVFFISAFDRPYKTYKWESIFPKIKIAGVDYDKTKEEEAGDNEAEANPFEEALQAQGMPVQQGGGGTVIIGGAYPSGSGMTEGQSMGEPVAAMGTAPASGMVGNPGFVGAQMIQTPPPAPVTPGVEVSPEMEEATAAYLEQLKEMTDALTRFVEQTKTMGQDADQINTLNKNLTGINAIYEIQLRSISSQLGTIDQINEQTRRMAKQIDELNTVYARMLEAMTVNMKMNGAANS